ncbi:MAG: NYN domain-containing protein [Desulfovibrionaceae bacterium]
MGRFAGFEEVYSAVYVDFDNIYTRFLEMDPETARAFGTMPHRWVKWLEIHALRMLYGEGVRRRILKRMCYLNPQRYQEFRHSFIRAAFQVVDCPPLTQQGKTSTDIHLVMDCMDDLSHSTRFDEFIILSGDADFTPLLIRLQEHARRTLVLSVGYSSPAYTAAAAWRIREDWFIQQALNEERPLDANLPLLPDGSPDGSPNGW